MGVSRRFVLKLAAAGGAATAATVLTAKKAQAREVVEPSREAVGMLYDSTRCIGCQACVSACKEANNLPYDRTADALFNSPRDLSSSTKNVIKLLAKGDGDIAFMKQQCMHCIDPACVSACMMGALHKEGEGKRLLPGERKGTGIVVYDVDTCVGCRYCQIACPFNVPKFEWTDATPQIVKCELCRHRAKKGVAGPLGVANPACCEVCPREAVIYGKREELLQEAKRRIEANPDRYEPHVYGEREGGGTQVLYLTAKKVPFTQLGLPSLPDRSAAHFSESVSHAPYLHGLTPLALYAASALVIARNRAKDEPAAGASAEKKS